jgi:hypothetical protein
MMMAEEADGETSRRPCAGTAGLIVGDVDAADRGSGKWRKWRGQARPRKDPGPEQRPIDPAMRKVGSETILTRFGSRVAEDSRTTWGGLGFDETVLGVGHPRMSGTCCVCCDVVVGLGGAMMCWAMWRDGLRMEEGADVVEYSDWERGHWWMRNQNHRRGRDRDYVCCPMRPEVDILRTWVVDEVVACR